MSLKLDYKALKKYRLTVFTVFVFCMMASFGFFAMRGMQKTSAASTAGFSAGNIISDAVMSNYNSMSVSDIQNFLTSKNPCNDYDYNKYLRLKAAYPNNSWHFENGHFICLSEERFGDGEVIGSGQTAAEIIHQAAQDYKINPQVLLVLLQKEQGLITDTYPNQVQYRAATGFGCPDTAACSTKYYGFKNQVRNAASMFREVLNGGWSNYPAYKTVYVQYNPNPGCGGTNVYIENRATSALYRYTPYQPNASALNAGYGTGDVCGAYGNRNFYLYFTDWFGSTQLDIPVATYQVIPDGEYVIASGLTYNTVLTADGTTNSSNVAMRSRNAGQTTQRWKTQYHADDHSYTFINIASGKALDLDSQSTRDGSNIHIYDKNETCAQRWHIVTNSDGSRTLLSACSKIAAIDVDSGSTTSGANVQVYSSNETPAQRWYLIPDATIADGIYDIAAGTNDNLRLDITNGLSVLGNGSNVQVYENNGTAAQKWQVKYNAQDGTYTIINPNREFSLDVLNGGTGNMSNVQMYRQNGTSAQKWYILPQGNGYVIISVKSGRVLDIENGGNYNGANVQLYESNQTKAQTWRFTSAANNQPVENGVYEIVAGTSSQRALDVNGGVANARNGTNVQIFTRNQTDAQKWRLTYDKTNDAYMIINVTSNLSLDVDSGSISNEANIQVFESNSTLAQRWYIKDNNDGSFTITSFKSGLALDIYSGGNFDGANVQQYASNNTAAQRWELIKLSD